MSGFSFAAFALFQVVMDCESVYNLLAHRYPVHRFLHTFLGASVLAVVGTALLVVFSPFIPARVRPRNRIVIVGSALFATWSHVLLDAAMHPDLRPFAPFSPSNPFLGAVSLLTLHVSCAALGVIGAAVIGARRYREVTSGQA
jgi:membrane-bound metal-dependent hydrolase YbcI (DUF457 family)